ncbi:zinc-ribbon domain-containing protein [Gammaproteobacteria bacterium]|nr:zinc-ribbon domain-containing protein [Gammaproteobacteria bacterium]
MLARRSVTPSYNFLVIHPEAAKDWHPTKNGTLRPENSTPRSDAKVWWLCPRGHNRRGRVKGNGCPECRTLNGGNAVDRE